MSDSRALERFRVAEAKIREIHQRRMWTATGQFYCDHCLETGCRRWPCDTIAALNEASLAMDDGGLGNGAPQQEKP